MRFNLSRIRGFIWVVGGLLLLSGPPRPDASGKEPAAAAPAAKAATSRAAETGPYGRDYLMPLARETWDYLAAHVDPRTGFPTDTQNPGGKTNTTNVGLYLASLGPAVEMGFLSREEAVERARKALDSLGRLPSKHGFLPNWVSVDGRSEAPRGFQMVSDFNKLVAGLIVVRQYFPEIADAATPLIDRIDWKWLYDSATGYASYGYDVQSGEKTGLGEWWLAADIRLASFFLVASGAAPPEFWDRLGRKQIEADGLTFFAPGYEVGGLFMHAMDGLFLDERGTEMGRSVADLAWHQIRTAREMGMPVWGWSNCNVPGSGYTEGGFLPWWVVTPHASALVIEYYPRHVVDNFRMLDAMGVRKPLQPGASAHGFRDSIDVRTRIVDQRYLCLDQAMTFLALANYLNDGTVRKAFSKDPLVAEGLRRLGHRLRTDPALHEEWAHRDTDGPKLRKAPDGTPVEVVIDLRRGETAVEIDNRSAGNDATITAQRKPFGLMINFDLGSNGAGESDVTIRIPPIDMRQYDQVVVYASGMRLDDQAGSFGFRVYLRDDQNQGQFGYLPEVPEYKRPLRLPDYARRGIFARPEEVSQVTLKFWGSPWYFSGKRTGARKGNVVIEKIVFKPKANRQS